MGETSDNKLLLRNENKLLDILKLIAALLIAASHCLPLAPNNDVNFFYGQWFLGFAFLSF